MASMILAALPLMSALVGLIWASATRIRNRRYHAAGSACLRRPMSRTFERPRSCGSGSARTMRRRPSSGSASTRRTPASRASRGRSRWTRRSASGGSTASARRLGPEQLYDPVHAPAEGQHLERGQHRARQGADGREADAPDRASTAFAARLENKSGHLRLRAAARSARGAVRGPARGRTRPRRAFFEAQPPGYRKVIGLVDRQREEGRDAPGAPEETDRRV